MEKKKENRKPNKGDGQRETDRQPGGGVRFGRLPYGHRGRGARLVAVHGAADALLVQVGRVVNHPADGRQHVPAGRELATRARHVPADRVVVPAIVRSSGAVFQTLSVVPQTPEIVVRSHEHGQLGARGPVNVDLADRRVGRHRPEHQHYDCGQPAHAAIVDFNEGGTRTAEDSAFGRR